MGCKRTAVKVVKAVAKTVSPILVRHIGEMVGVVEAASAEDPAFLTNDVKRKMVIASGKAKARELGQEVKTSTIGLLTEYAVIALNKAGESIDDLGQDDTAETVAESM